MVVNFQNRPNNTKPAFLIKNFHRELPLCNVVFDEITVANKFNVFCVLSFQGVYTFFLKYLSFGILSSLKLYQNFGPD